MMPVICCSRFAVFAVFAVLLLLFFRGGLQKPRISMAEGGLAAVFSGHYQRAPSPKTRRSTVEVLQVLRDEVAAGEFLVGVDQALGDRAGRLAGGKASAVETSDATNAQARRGQKALISGVRVVKVDVLLGERDAEPLREINRRLPAHSRQHTALPRRQQTAV